MSQPPNGISIGSAVFAYTAPNAFQWGEEPHKLPLPLGGSGPHLYLSVAGYVNGCNKAHYYYYYLSPEPD